MIRVAEPEDFPSILEMCREFWGHTHFTEEFDGDHTMNMIWMAYDHGLLAVVDDGGIHGFIAAIQSFLLGSRQAKTATELAWWINPSYRGKMVGVKLISFLESLCVQADVKYLNMAYMESSMPEKVKIIYESLGYKLQESVYTKVLKDGGSNGSNIRGGVSSNRAILSK